MREGKNRQAQVGEVGRKDAGGHVKGDGACPREFMMTQKVQGRKENLPVVMLLINSHC